MSKFRLVLKVKEPSKDSQYRFKSLGLWRTFSLVSYRNRAYRPSHLIPISALPWKVSTCDQIWQGSGALQHIKSEIICKKRVAEKWGVFVQTNLRSHYLLFTTEYDSLLSTSTPLEKRCDAFWMHVQIPENLHSIKRSVEQTHSPNIFLLLYCSRNLFIIMKFFLFQIVELIR